MNFITNPVFAGVTYSRDPIGGGEDFLLDLIADDPILAFSLRQLRASSGYCLQVERADNAALVDIGFANGYVDISALQTLLAQTDIYLNRWYGQDEGETNLIAQNYFYKPKITVSGGKVKINFGWHTSEVAANVFLGAMRTQEHISSTAPKSFFVCNPYQVGGNNYLQDFGVNFWNVQFYAGSLFAYNGTGVAGAVTNGLSQYGVLYEAANSVSLRRNGNAIASGNPGGVSHNDYFSLGNYAAGTNGYGFRGEINEYIAFDDSVSGASVIENNQINYFEVI